MKTWINGFGTCFALVSAITLGGFIYHCYPKTLDQAGLTELIRLSYEESLQVQASLGKGYNDEN